MKLEEIVNVSLSANYEEGTLVAQATLSLDVRCAKKSLKNFKNLVKLKYKKLFFDAFHCRPHLLNLEIIITLLY